MLLAAAPGFCQARVGEHPAPVSEHQVKAAFLYNFAKFVRWPSPAQARGPVRICLAEEGRIGEALRVLVAGQTLDGCPFEVTAIASLEQAASCQILFVGEASRKRSRSLLARLETRPVLTVGESEGFAATEGMMNLRVAGGRVHVEVNPEAASRAGLQVSSKLLRLAEIVPPKGER